MKRFILAFLFGTLSFHAQAGLQSPAALTMTPAGEVNGEYSVSVVLKDCANSEDISQVNVKELELVIANIFDKDLDSNDKASVRQFAQAALDGGYEAKRAYDAKDGSWMRENLERFVESAGEGNSFNLATLVLPASPEELDGAGVLLASQHLALMADALVTGVDIQPVFLTWLLEGSGEEGPLDGIQSMAGLAHACNPGDRMVSPGTPTRVVECCDEECWETRVCERTVVTCHSTETAEDGSKSVRSYPVPVERCTECGADAPESFQSEF